MMGVKEEIEFLNYIGSLELESMQWDKIDLESERKAENLQVYRYRLNQETELTLQIIVPRKDGKKVNTQSECFEFFIPKKAMRSYKIKKFKKEGTEEVLRVAEIEMNKEKFYQYTYFKLKKKIVEQINEFQQKYKEID